MDQHPDITELFMDGRAIDAAMRKAVREALRRHKALGEPIVIGVNDRPVWIQPEDIVIPPDVEPACSLAIPK